MSEVKDDDLAYTCECGSVHFHLLKSRKIECVACGKQTEIISEPLAWKNGCNSIIPDAQKSEMIEYGKYGGEFKIAAQMAERHNIPLHALIDI